MPSSPLSLREAYERQRREVGARVAAGDTVRGWKIGATSAAVQELLSTREPFYGVLLAGGELLPGATATLEGWFGVMLECEVAFILGRDLRGPGVDVEQVQAATRAVGAAFEVVGSTRPGRPSGVCDIVALNGCNSRFMLSASVLSPDGLDIADVEVELEGPDRRVITGSAADVMGNPYAAVAWLANRLAECGSLISAGQVVLSGCMTRPVPVARGGQYGATFGPLGTLAIGFG